MSAPDFKHQLYLIENFIECVKQRAERCDRYDKDWHYAIYSQTDDFVMGQQILVSNTVEVLDDDTEVYPVDAQTHQFSFHCSDENIQDVIDLAIEQKPHASSEELIRALNYYLDNDTFLDLHK